MSQQRECYQKVPRRRARRLERIEPAGSTPINRDKPHLPSLHLLLHPFGILLDAVADQSTPTAELHFGSDLSPDAFIIGQQTFVAEIVQFSRHFSYPRGRSRGKTDDCRYFLS
jgi:hypothetical protein